MARAAEAFAGLDTALGSIQRTDISAPVFAGDTIRAETEVLEKRESHSRPGQGIVTVRTRGLNQDDVVVIEFERTVMMPLA